MNFLIWFIAPRVMLGESRVESGVVQRLAGRAGEPDLSLSFQEQHPYCPGKDTTTGAH